MTHLALWSRCQWNGSETITEAIGQALSHLADLKSLEIDNGSSPLLEAISRACPQLEHFGWRGLSQVASLQSMAESLTQLRSLELRQFGRVKSAKPTYWAWFEAIAERGLPPLAGREQNYLIQFVVINFHRLCRPICEENGI